MLSKKHITDTEMDLDLDAISHGDFRDVPQGHLTFLKRPYNTSWKVQNILLLLHFSPQLQVASRISVVDWFMQCYNCVFYGRLENSPKKARALIGCKSCLLTPWRHRTSARFWRGDTASKEKFKLTSCFLFLVAVFSKGNRKHVLCVSIELYKHSWTWSLGELEKVVETLACGSCSHSISRSPKLPLVFV